MFEEYKRESNRQFKGLLRYAALGILIHIVGWGLLILGLEMWLG